MSPRPPGRPRSPGRAAPRSRADEGHAQGEKVEGRQAVRELLRAGRRRVYQLAVAEGIDETGVVAEILELAQSARVPVRRVDRHQIAAAAESDAPQGVVARAEPLPEAELDALTRRGPDRPAPFLVVLDGVTDPHNLGAVMRSAVCAGATGMVVGRHRSAGLTATAVKAAAGAVEHLPVARVAGIPAALRVLASAGVWSVGLDVGASHSVWDLDLAGEPVALVLGSEGRGLSRLVRERCDAVVEIPLAGPLGSLNVSAAAALGCFEVARQRSRTTN